MRLIWTDDALEDRLKIYDYIEANNPDAALDLDEIFFKSAQRLVSNPELGHPGRAPGTRELVVHRHYILLYDVIGDAVRVLGVLHTARMWPPLK
jgi:addiction module RelE/StbE family toxin